MSLIYCKKAKKKYINTSMKFKNYKLQYVEMIFYTLSDLYFRKKNGNWAL